MTSEIRFLFCAILPEIGDAQPPPCCPVCGAAQVPPESDDGVPPPEQHLYACDASYLRPEDEPGPWEPCAPCKRVPLMVAAAWIRERAAHEGKTILASVAIEAPPYMLADRSPLGLLPGEVAAERAPEVCPSCGAATVKGPSSFWSYACGARFWATSTRPGPSGPVPMTWRGIGECTRPPVERLLEVLRDAAKREGAGELATACGDVLGD
ncbi:MAG: hypothetical protein U0441_36455 [Polyangiaceae bacterium]